MTDDTELGPEALAAIDECERLIGRLRYGSTSGAQSAIDRLKAAFPALEKVLEETRQHEIQAAVAAAAGAAATHTWRITKTSVECTSCHLGTVDHVLRMGALPECGSGEPCASFTSGHLVLMGDDDTSRRCTYCKTVFPATAGAECVGGAR
jgi:hypothetical protein